MRSSGIKNLAEKKFAQTIAAVMKFKEKIFRVRLFGKFIGIYEAMDKESFKVYLICLNHVFNVCSFGYLIPTTDNDEIHYAPYIRINDFMRQFLENRVSTEEF